MDIYEFTQALWRRRWLLVAGLVLLGVVVATMSIDFSSGRMRAEPKFEATVEMAVVPADVDSLAVDLGPDSFAGQANIFASLAGSTQAAIEIEDQQGVPIYDLSASATERDRFFSVTATSDSADGAVTAALGAFHWLEQRLAEPVLMASAPTTTVPESLLDEDGHFPGTVRVELDHALAGDGEGLWLVARTAPGEDFAFRLDDTTVETVSEHSAVLAPGGEILLDLENAQGDLLDSASLQAPGLPDIEARGYRLVMSVQRGLLRGSADNPRLDASRIDVTWEPVASPEDLAGGEVAEVGILLLTDRPVPNSIGGRRTPLLIVAVVTAGIIGLVVMTVTVDSWAQERRRRRQAEAESQAQITGIPNHPIPMPAPEHPERRRTIP